MEKSTDNDSTSSRAERRKPLRASSKEGLIKLAKAQGLKGHFLCHFTSASEGGGVPYFTWTLFDPPTPSEETLRKSHGWFGGSELHPIARESLEN